MNIARLSNFISDPLKKKAPLRHPFRTYVSEAISRNGARAIAGLAIAAAFLPTIGAAATPITFRTTTNVELTNLDPVATTAAVTMTHGLMVYDTLFALDEHGTPQPQMVDTYTRSPDCLTYRFKLRPGLLFSDGSPVESKDVIASIKRWALKRSEGRLLSERLERIEAIDKTSFEIDLKKPFSRLIPALANPSLPMFVMREQEANTDPSVPITKVIGSGPFVFRQDLSRPDDVAVYDKSPTYRPRSEPASGLAGGKIVHVDRVEERYMPDDTALEALKNGALDFIYSPPQQAIEALQQDPDFTIRVLDRQGMMGAIRLNTLHPPFDNVHARMAVQAAIDQAAILSSMVGSKEKYRVCYSIFGCGAVPFETDVGAGQWEAQNMPKARRLLQESGYDGRPIVVMIPLDDDQLFAQGSALINALRAAGFTVDAQSMVWSELAARLENKDDPARDPRGWDIFGAWFPGSFFSDPLNLALDTSGDPKTGWYGWPKDSAIEALRDALADAPTADDQRKIVDQIQTRYYQTIPQVYTGEYYIASIWRSNVTGIVSASYPVFWNLKMTQ